MINTKGGGAPLGSSLMALELRGLSALRMSSTLSGRQFFVASSEMYVGRRVGTDAEKGARRSRGARLPARRRV